VSHTSRNPPWERDELILALDLYFRHRPSELSQSHEEVLRLSKILRALPIHQHRPDTVRFRNANGVYMKLGNFLQFDPAYQGTGLRQGGKRDEQVWKDFADKPDLLRKTAQAIIDGMDQCVESPMVDEDEDGFPEGRVLYRLHRQRERNRELVAKAKRRAEAEGRLCCIVCGFDFHQEYGEIGKGFIECHHTVPVSEYVRGQ
jgi:5-methylcytosine-specific restriction protein A